MTSTSIAHSGRQNKGILPPPPPPPAIGYSDGRYHSIPCPSLEHGGDNDGRNLSVRMMSDGGYSLKCWSHGCSYKSIADALGVERKRRPARSNSWAQWLVAEYEHSDGKPRRVYRKDFPQDFGGATECSFSGCSEASRHKHIWGGKGESPRDCLLLLWGEDIKNNRLLVVEGEKAAAALVGHGVNAAGFTPATWRGGAETASIVDWSRAKKRDVVLWPDAGDVGARAMDKAFYALGRAGAKSVSGVSVSWLQDGQDAADLTNQDIYAVLAGVSAYTPNPTPAPKITKNPITNPSVLSDLDNPLNPMAHGDIFMARQLLLQSPEQLLIARHRNGVDTLCDNGFGIWRSPLDDGLGLLITEASRNWLGGAITAPGATGASRNALGTIMTLARRYTAAAGWEALLRTTGSARGQLEKERTSGNQTAATALSLLTEGRWVDLDTDKAALGARTD